VLSIMSEGRFAMIEPREDFPPQFGHSMWKRHALFGLALCVAGVVLCVSVALFIWGVAVLALGLVWTVSACMVGTMQEHAEVRRHSPDQPRPST
jgi:uncharacterized membrane protein